MLRTLVLIVLGFAGFSATVHAQPSVPATFYGTASIDGMAVADGTPVRAFIDGKDCTQLPAKGAVLDQGVSVYLVSVMHESQEPGCGRTGRTITFTVGGRAAQEAEWKEGVRDLGLNAGTGSPLPLPPATATAASNNTATQTGAARFTPKPAISALPTDDPGVRPRGGGTDGGPAGATGENGSPALGMVIVVLGAVAAVGAAIGAWLSHRRPGG